METTVILRLTGPQVESILSLITHYGDEASIQYPDDVDADLLDEAYDTLLDAVS